MFAWLRHTRRSGAGPYGERSFRALLLDEEEEYAEVISTLEALALTGAANTHQLNNLGVAQWEVGAADAALGSFSAALAADASNVAAYLNRGKLHAEEGRRDLALEDFEAAVRQAPRDFSCHVVLAFHLLEDGRAADSIPRFLSAMDLGADSDVLSRALVKAYRAAGMEADAQKHLALAARRRQGA